MTDPVTAKIESLRDWRGDLLARVRQAIMSADPTITEEIKWRKVTNPLGVPTWCCGGIICTGESYKDKVKLTFMRAAMSPTPTVSSTCPRTACAARSTFGKATRLTH